MESVVMHCRPNLMSVPGGDKGRFPASLGRIGGDRHRPARHRGGRQWRQALDKIGPGLAFGGREFLPALGVAKQFALLDLGHREEQTNGLKTALTLIGGQLAKRKKQGAHTRTILGSQAIKHGFLAFGGQVVEP